MISTILHIVGLHGDIDGNQFLHYSEEKARFKDKQYIFLPVNDGIGNLEQTSEVSGCHWSFVLIHRSSRQAHYVDSLFVDNPQWQYCAATIVAGVELLLDEEYDFVIEHNTPNQYYYNYSKGDAGPCGPFVYYMMNLYIGSVIIPFQDRDQEADIDFAIGNGLGRMPYWNFHSQEVRSYIMDRAVRVKTEMVWKQAAADHDRAAMVGLQSPPTMQEYPWRLDCPGPTGNARKEAFQTGRIVENAGYEENEGIRETVGGEQASLKHWASNSSQTTDETDSEDLFAGCNPVASFRTAISKETTYSIAAIKASEISAKVENKTIEDYIEAHQLAHLHVDQYDTSHVEETRTTVDDEPELVWAGEDTEVPYVSAHLPKRDLQNYLAGQGPASDH